MKNSGFLGMLGTFLVLGLISFISESWGGEWRGNTYYLKQETEYSYSYKNKCLLWVPPVAEGRGLGNLEVSSFCRVEERLKNSREKMFEVTQHSSSRWDKEIWEDFLLCVSDDLLKGKSKIREGRFEVPNYMQQALASFNSDIEEKKSYIFDRELYDNYKEQQRGKKKQPQLEHTTQEEGKDRPADKDNKKSLPFTAGLGLNLDTGLAAGVGGLFGLCFDWVAGTWIQKSVAHWVGKKEPRADEMEDRDLFEEEEKSSGSQSIIGLMARVTADLIVGGTTFAGVFCLLQILEKAARE